MVSHSDTKAEAHQSEARLGSPFDRAGKRTRRSEGRSALPISSFS